VLTYLDGILNLGDAGPAQRLSFFYQYLDHPDDMISTDAFLEFAKTNDRDVGEIAPKLNPEKFRKLLLDPKTPAERLGLFAFLLGAGKNQKDADLLRGMIEKPTTRTQGALDGLLSGFIQLQPEAGWKIVYSILGDKKKKFNDRYAAFRVLSFYYSWDAKAYHTPVMHGIGLMLADGNLADFAIEKLRRWEEWSMTPTVLSLFKKDSHAAPIVQRAIVRYAVCCPLPGAKAFVNNLSKTDPELLKEVLESLAFEKGLNDADSK
jgi:hypothetical protein